MIEDRSLIAFDLDGTLFDTAPDFLIAINALERKYGKKESGFDDIRSRVSEGALALIQFSFNLNPDSSNLINLKNELLEIYLDCCLQKTKLFSGISDLLINLDKKDMTWGIVTNKPLLYTDKIIKDKLKNYNYSFVICPDHTNTRKPDPSGLLLACKLTNSDPKLSMYIGDHKVDIEAGKNAGMKTIAASYGYCNISSEKDWGASMFVTKPQELKKLIF